MAKASIDDVIRRHVQELVAKKDPRDGRGWLRVVATKDKTSRDQPRQVPWAECDRAGCAFMRYAGTKGKLCYGHGLEEGTAQPRYSIGRDIREQVQAVLGRPKKRVVTTQRY
jgi:hypothetical protein